MYSRMTYILYYIPSLFIPIWISLARITSRKVICILFPCLTLQATSLFSSFRGEFSLTHGDELQSLSSISDPNHLKDNQIAVMYRTNKYSVTMSTNAFQLLLQYLQDEKAVLFIKIINQYLKVRGIIIHCCC